MLVRALVAIPTAKGLIPKGGLLEIPDSILAKLAGKVEAVSQAQPEAHQGNNEQPPIVSAAFKCRACGSDSFRMGLVSRICAAPGCQVPETQHKLGRIRK